MSLNRMESEDDWYDVGDAAALKSARRQATATPPTQSSMRLGTPPPPPLADTAPRFETQKSFKEEAPNEEDAIKGEPTSLIALENESSSSEEEQRNVGPIAGALFTESLQDNLVQEQPIPQSTITDTSGPLGAPEVSSDQSPIEPAPSPYSPSPILTRQATEKAAPVEPIAEQAKDPEKAKEEAETRKESIAVPTATQPPITAARTTATPQAVPINLKSLIAKGRSYIPPRVIAVLLGTWAGFKDSSNMLQFVKYCDRDHSILKTFIHCTVLNTIFILSLFTIVDLVAPLQPTGAFAFVWETLFSLLWVVPMYAVTQILGITWYEEIYRKCVQVRASERNRPTQPTRDVSFIGVSELVMKFLVTLVYGVLAALIAMVLPRNFIAICGLNIPVGFLVSFAMSCWLHAFYCFDYRFLDQGRVDRGQPSDAANGSAAQSAKLIPAKLSFLITIFERKWPYYLGYGASHIMVRTAMEWMELPMFARMAVCSALFAVNVVTTVEASVRWEGDSTVGRLPIFTPFYKKLSQWVATANAKRASSSKRAKGSTGSSAAQSSTDNK